MKHILSSRMGISFSRLILLCFCSLNATSAFIPKQEYDVSDLPPSPSNLLKEAGKAQDKKEKQEIEQIIKRVIKSSDKELEEQAEKLVSDKDKLAQFLTFLPKDILQEEEREKDLTVSKEVKDLLDLQYKDPELLRKNISLKLKNTDVRQAIELIGKTADLDFFIDPRVGGIVNNIHLKEVSVGSALNIILSGNKPKLALVKDLEIFRIVLLSDAIYLLKNRAQDLFEQDFVSDFITIYNAKWSESFKLRLEKMWFGIVGEAAEKDGYFLVFDDHTKKIFFRGRKLQVQDFKKFLQEVDAKIPQVRIETRVVIASKDFEESFGLQISGIYNRSASVAQHSWGFVGAGPVSSGGNGDFPTGGLMDWALNMLPSSANQFLNLPLIFGGKDLNTRRLNLVLNASENQNEIKTILKPTLLVNSEEPAEILVGEEVPIETSVEEKIEGSLRNVNTINYKDLGMKLKVKPVVAPDNNSVFLDIYVENSFVKDATTFNAKTSIITTSKSKNRVLLKSGQTTMIGGLIKTDKRKYKQGIPLLQNIPLLGNLFKGSKRSEGDSQLMIFISPTVV
jgi:type IV pilus assembly protein PilQ